MPPKKRITQETFDAMVRESMETFGLGAEEAVQDVVEQCEIQGIDLSNIACRPPGERQEHPVLAHLEALAQLSSGSGAEVEEQLRKLLTEQIRPALEQPEGLRAAVQAQAASTLLRATSVMGTPSAAMLVLPVFEFLMQQSSDARDALGAEGVQLLMDLLERHVRHEPALVAAILNAIRASCRQSEANRIMYVDRGLIAHLVSLAQQYGPDIVRGGAGTDAVLQAACSTMRVLTVSDDERARMGHGHQHLMRLAEAGAAMALTEALKAAAAAAAAAADSTAAAAADAQPQIRAVSHVMHALATLCAREDVVAPVMAAGTLTHTLTLLRRFLPADASLVGHALGLLRALAGSDAVKRALAEPDALALAVQALNRHVASASVAEHGCGLLAAITLRQPAISEQVAQHGGFDCIAAAMRAHPTAVRVQRQACLALRNMVARNKDLIGQAKAAGAEELCVAASRLAGVADVAKAALRDMGLD